MLLQTLAEIPAGVTVNESGLLCDLHGQPLPRRLRLAPGGQGFLLGPNDALLPKGALITYRTTSVCLADWQRKNGGVFSLVGTFCVAAVCVNVLRKPKHILHVVLENTALCAALQVALWALGECWCMPPQAAPSPTAAGWVMPGRCSAAQGSPCLTA
jgi:hypothetical protein